MTDELRHECGLAAVATLAGPQTSPSPAGHTDSRSDVASLVPRMLLDMQTRGQLAAGFTTYNPDRAQLVDTHKDVGTVREVFRMSHPEKHAAIMTEYAGLAGIGHTRYATTGADDPRYAQPFERHHGRPCKWFSFAFNGTLANYGQLRDGVLAKRGYHFSLDTDTEIMMHALAHGLRGEKKRPALKRVMLEVSQLFDGAYCMVFLDALGRMFVARDPLGFHPMSWATQEGLFAAASESVALANLGFTDIHALRPGQMAIVENGKFRMVNYAASTKRSRCFFEWTYFSKAMSEIPNG